MADDIVTRLRELMADLLYNPDCDDEGCGDCAWHRIGADAIAEIKRLRETEQDLRAYTEQDSCEIERLRAVGDALAAVVNDEHRPRFCEIGCPNRTAVEAWEEARRG